jgi:predicted transcriptional regulator
MAMPAPARELPPRLELECLKALWSLREANVRQVQAALRPGRTLAYTTVMTIMDRLARRGCVERRKSGRSFVYSPVLTREAVVRTAVKELINDYFDGSPDSLCAYLSDGSTADVRTWK